MYVISKQPNNCIVMFFIISLLLSSDLLQAQSKKVKVIELRNYLMRPGQRDRFIDSFEAKILDTLNGRGNYVLGQYRLKNAPDDFVWFRGFYDMSSRLRALEGFYTSPYWQKHVSIPQKYVLGYTNVYLLKPLSILNKSIDTTYAFETARFDKQNGLTVVDFYVANERRNQLLDFVATIYDSVMHVSGVKDFSYWISETAPNDYPNLPVFQDKNLLVIITFFKSEPEYKAALKRIESGMSEEQRFQMKRLVSTKATWVLYPTKKSFHIQEK